MQLGWHNVALKHFSFNAVMPLPLTRGHSAGPAAKISWTTMTPHTLGRAPCARALPLLIQTWQKQVWYLLQIPVVVLTLIIFAAGVPLTSRARHLPRAQTQRMAAASDSGQIQGIMKTLVYDKNTQ